MTRRSSSMRHRVLGLAVASVLLAAACGSSTPPTAAPGTASTSSQAPAESAAAAVTTLTLRYCWGGEGEVKAMEKVIQAWNGAHPEIQVKGISGNIKTEEIAASVAGGAPP